MPLGEKRGEKEDAVPALKKRRDIRVTEPESLKGDKEQEGEQNLPYALGYDEKIDEAEQGSEDQREDHGAGEVLIRDLVVLWRHQRKK